MLKTAQVKKLISISIKVVCGLSFYIELENKEYVGILKFIKEY